MLAEMRALGLGIIVVDQTPAAVAAQVVRNTNLKIAHRTVAKEDRETLADAMLMHPAHAELMGRLRPGQAYVYADRFYRPHLVRVPLQTPKPLDSSRKVVSLGTRPPNNNELLAWMRKRPWYKSSLVERHRMWTEKVDRALSAISDVSNYVAAAKDDIKAHADVLKALQDQSSDTSDVKLRSEIAAAKILFVEACGDYRPKLTKAMDGIDRDLRSLEAEYRLLVVAGENISPKREVVDNVKVARTAFASITRLIDVLTNLVT